MEKNDDNIIEGQKVEGSSNKYTTVSEISSKKKTSNLNFGKQVFIPFSGAEISVLKEFPSTVRQKWRTT